jgi:NADH:ubiquinone oxidoreductase subunit E
MIDLMKFSEEQIKQLDELIETYGKKDGGLIPLLEKAQDLLGYLPESVQQRIADKTDISPNRIYGVITFYSFFTMEPRAKHRIQLCMGTACYVKGAEEIMKKLEKNYNVKMGESTKDGRFTFEKARCLGACGLAPVMVIDDKVYGKVNIDEIDDILSQYE